MSFKPITTNLRFLNSINFRRILLDTEDRKVNKPSHCILCSLGLKRNVALDPQESSVPTQELVLNCKCVSSQQLDIMVDFWA